MTKATREVTWALVLTGAIVAIVAVLTWTGLRTGHLGLGASPAPQVATTTSPRPTVTPTAPPTAMALPVIPADPAVVADFATEVASLGGAYALGWIDGDGLHLLGSSPGEAAWSTIKLPLSIAAVEQTGGQVVDDATWDLVEAAITRSDNAAASALWSTLGSSEEAAAAVDAVLAAYGSPEVHTESAEVRPPFSSFGQTEWSVESQARFASRLACVPDSSAVGRVRAAMGRVVSDQRWGIGGLESAHVKGGWGPEPAGAYVLRQLGDVEVAGERYALALSARASTGDYARATEDATELVQWWARTAAPGAPGLACPGR